MKKKQRRGRPATKGSEKAGLEEVRQKLETQNRAIRKILKQLTLPQPEQAKEPSKNTSTNTLKS